MTPERRQEILYTINNRLRVIINKMFENLDFVKYDYETNQDEFVKNVNEKLEKTIRAMIRKLPDKK